MEHPEKLWAVILADDGPQVVKRTDVIKTASDGKYMIYRKKSDADWIVTRFKRTNPEQHLYVAEVIISWSEVHDQST